MRPRLLVSASLPLPPPTPTLSPDASYSCYGDPVERSYQVTEALELISPTLLLELISPRAMSGQICPICLTNPKDMAFGCGHQIF
ncbi:hypothetical protein ACS0TY_035285 [Phlomoides rotata]